MGDIVLLTPSGSGGAGGTAGAGDHRYAQTRGQEIGVQGRLRVTDAETVDIVQMVLAGKINKTLVNLLANRRGAVG